MYDLCEKYYKPITVEYYIANGVSWVPRLTLLDLNKALSERNSFVCRGLNRTIILSAPPLIYIQKLTSSPHPTTVTELQTPGIMVRAGLLVPASILGPADSSQQSIGGPPPTPESKPSLQRRRLCAGESWSCSSPWRPPPSSHASHAGASALVFPLRLCDPSLNSFTALPRCPLSREALLSDM